ncbi:signal peptidase II . Aspartic peptidase. MEROPS family A08 [Celeribacter baekdonensis]|jgi:signal peptidase II|uniref:Lipoprotein signal peptidase n=1 Tax=Celeribacter baekdonensis TaxID=875171 RepID=A0A1G7KSU7_9RHOB|nr:signal peptidase II [Celeribacter baekdonensis]SDF40255.1 signal peptidase II . Aspartic peptidase. MEROPS family A08 [Celeribacter baekdonensis]
MRITTYAALMTFVIDQLSKWVVVHALNLRSVGEIEVFPPYIVFRMAWNRGANFGLFAEHGAFLRWGWVILAVVISAWVLSWVKRENFTRLGQVSAGLLIGGALGNALDRVLYGAVADFLNTSCCGFRNPYAFNVADIAIFAGAFGLILFTGERKNRA